MRTLPLLLALAALVAPAAATAAPVAADPAATEVTALGGTLVWTSGAGPEKLMQRGPNGTIAPVAGSDQTGYLSPDLGRDARGRLVLTYGRCTDSGCVHFRDDLRGRRRSLAKVAPKRCVLTSTPAVWGKRMAFGAQCFRTEDGKQTIDFDRTGLYVKTGSRPARRLPTPRNARVTGNNVTDVDLRGSHVAALYADYDQFAVVQTVGGRERKSVFTASTEGDANHVTAGVDLGSGDVRLWYLTRAEVPGEPVRTVIDRMLRGCADAQVIMGPATLERDHPFVDMAADGSRLYVVEPGVGILEHTYRPTHGDC